MRSISQTFSDHLQAREFNVASLLLRKHGAEKTRAHFWLATHAWRGENGEVELLEHLSRANLTPQDWSDVYLRRLAMKAPLNGTDPILDWLVDKVDFELLDKRCVIHHACFHGRHDIFDVIEKKLAEVGKPVDWNDDRPGVGPPLFMALKEAREETTLELIRRGADGTLPISPGLLRAGLARNIIEAASLAGPEDAADIYRKAKRKASLEQVAQKAGKAVSTGMRKIGIRM